MAARRTGNPAQDRYLRFSTHFSREAPDAHGTVRGDRVYISHGTKLHVMRTSGKRKLVRGVDLSGREFYGWIDKDEVQTARAYKDVHGAAPEGKRNSRRGASRRNPAAGMVPAQIRIQKNGSARVFVTPANAQKLNPDEHVWLFGSSAPQMRRARAIHKKLVAARIPAHLEKWPYGGLKMSFPESDYRRAEGIADKMYVGESWWPTKGKRKNPAVRTSKTKGGFTGLKSMMTRRKPPSKVGKAFGTKTNQRYLVSLSDSTMDRHYASKMSTAKEAGIRLAKKHGRSKFFVQNQVTGSIINFDVT